MSFWFCMADNIFPINTLGVYTLIGLNIGTPKILNFPFVPNGKLIILGVPILKHITVTLIMCLKTFIQNPFDYIYLRNEFHFSDVYRSENYIGLHAK